MGDDITIGVTEIVNNIEVTAQPNDQIVDISVTDNADNVTLNITPTVVEVNINKGSSFAQWGDLYGTLSDQTDLQNTLNLKANLVDGKVPASELPSYVDDIIEVANYAALPATGEIGKIYVTLDNNKIYRWSGSIYIEIASNSAIWGAITGTLTDQTDLVTALNAKQNTITLTTTGTTGAATLVGSTLNIPNYTTDISGLVPYTGATTNVDLGSHKLTASDLVINHASGSGVAASITKGGNGEALTVVKSSGSGNAASITGGTTLLSELHLTTDLADDYIASAATWNAKQAALNGTGFVKASGTTISYDNTTYLSGTVAIANGGTGATTAGAALTNLGGTTVGTNIFTSANPSPYTSAYLKVKPDNSVEWLEANAFRIAIGAGTGNGTVTSVEAVGSYGGLTLTGTVTGSGQITLGGTPTGTWPISISGNASSVNTVQVSTNADFYLTFADANNGSPTSEFLYTIGTVKVNPSTGALTAGSFVKSGGTSGQFLKADGSIDSTSYQAALTNPVTGTGTTNYIPKFTGASAIGNSLIYDNGTNVGIGTTSPAAKLTVNTATNENVAIGSLASIPTGRTLILQTSSSGGSIETYSSITGGYVNTLINPNGGNVGIGTTSPATLLQLNSATGVNTTLSFSENGTLKWYNRHNAGDGSYQIVDVTNSATRLNITSGGNVGIGTTSPLTALTVSGNLSLFTTNQIRLYNSAKNNWAEMSSPLLGGDTEIDFKLVTKSGIVYVNPTGNVGIGTTSPQQKLEVNGNIFLNKLDATLELGNGVGSAGYSTIGYNNTIDFLDIKHKYSAGGIRMLVNTSTEAMRITSGGNVGIGTSSPSTKTHIVGSASTGGVLRIENDQNQGDVNHGIINLVNTASYGIGNDASIMFSAKDSSGTIHPRASIGMKVSSSSTSGDLVFNTRNNSSYGERMRITSAGNVGIGTMSPAAKLTINADANSNANAITIYSNNTTAQSYTSIGSYYANGNTNVNSQIRFGNENTNGGESYLALATGSSSATERMRITSGGQVEINRTSDLGNGFLEVNGSASRSALACNQVSTSSSPQIYFSNPNGIVGSIQTNGSSTGYYTSSDYRLKTDLKSFNGLDLISQIKVYDYEWKIDNSRSYGVIAHELQKVIPQAVTGEKDAEKMQSVDYSKIVPILVQSIQELKEEIELLKSKL